MNLPPLILHIGNHKTGTTSIQGYCIGNQDILDGAGIHWPKEKLENTPLQHSGLARWLQTGEEQRVAGFIERADKGAIEAGAKSLLLSGEGFSNLAPQEIQTFKGIIGPRDIRVLVYFRNVYEFLISMLTERMKRGRMLGHPDTKLSNTSRKLDYAGLIRDWESFFGEESVEVFCYDEIKHRLVPDFLTIIGVADGADMPVPKGHLNKSLPFALASFLYFTGEITSMADYKAAVKKLRPAYLPGNVWTLQLSLFVQALVNLCDYSIDHPKLKSFERQLTKKPKLDTETKGAAKMTEALEALFSDSDNESNSNSD